MDRSNMAEVRNPVLRLPAAKRLMNLPPETRAVLAEIFADLGRDARERARIAQAARNRRLMGMH